MGANVKAIFAAILPPNQVSAKSLGRRRAFHVAKARSASLPPWFIVQVCGACVSAARQPSRTRAPRLGFAPLGMAHRKQLRGRSVTRVCGLKAPAIHDALRLARHRWGIGLSARRRALLRWARSAVRSARFLSLIHISEP